MHEKIVKNEIDEYQRRNMESDIQTGKHKKLVELKTQILREKG
jgi:hypothetical protein